MSKITAQLRNAPHIAINGHCSSERRENWLITQRTETVIDLLSRGVITRKTATSRLENLLISRDRINAIVESASGVFFAKTRHGASLQTEGIRRA